MSVAARFRPEQLVRRCDGPRPGRHAKPRTPGPIVDKIRAFTREAAMTPKFKELMANIGQDVDYQDQAEFKAFWDADAKRIEDAVRSIGRVEG